VDDRAGEAQREEERRYGGRRRILTKQCQQMSTSPGGIGLTPIPVCSIRRFGELFCKHSLDERAILWECGASVLLEDSDVIPRPTKSAELLWSRRAGLEIAPADEALLEKGDVVGCCDPEVEIPVAGDGEACVREANAVEDGARDEHL
jgi:hypothetical protein